MTKAQPRSLLAGVVTAVFVSLCVSGCTSAKQPSSGPFASVQIRGHTSDQIRAATVVVFQEDGYTSSNERRGNLVFEKEGSQWDKIAYGNWIDDGAVCIRVKASIVPTADGAYRLQCQAYRVQNRGDPVFEEQTPLNYSRSKPFQSLLEKVARQMNN